MPVRFSPVQDSLVGCRAAAAWPPREDGTSLPGVVRGCDLTWSRKSEADVRQISIPDLPNHVTARCFQYLAYLGGLFVLPGTYSDLQLNDDNFTHISTMLRSLSGIFLRSNDDYFRSSDMATSNN